VSDQSASPDSGTANVRPRRRRRRAPIIAAAVGLVLALFLVVLVTSKKDPGSGLLRLDGLQAAPEIEGTSVLDGRAFSLGQRRGRWMVVNFFAPSCPPCIQEHPNLVAFWNRHRGLGDAGLVSVLSNFGATDSVESAREFFNELGGDWPVIDDLDAELGVEYGVIKYPETYVVDPNGFLVAKFRGPVVAGEIDALIAELDAQPS
jgi:cytochrome c biogenesis protein CcmG, thiol:disulfide interchange protein DsbE